MIISDEQKIEYEQRLEKLIKQKSDIENKIVKKGPSKEPLKEDYYRTNEKGEQIFLSDEYTKDHQDWEKNKPELKVLKTELLCINTDIRYIKIMLKKGD